MFSQFLNVPSSYFVVNILVVHTFNDSEFKDNNYNRILYCQNLTRVTV